METVIPPDKTSGHVIQKYHFKILSYDKKAENGFSCEEKEYPEEKPQENVEPVLSQETNEEKDEVMMQMLKKADELSTNLVKMQMQLEKQQEEFEKRLEEVKLSAFEEGREVGEKRCLEQMEKRIEEQKSRLVATIEALQQSKDMFLKKVDTIEEELIETALDLARQVIAKEVQNESKEIALRLAKLLLTEVKEAAKISLKVNPDDYEYVMEHLQGGAKNVEIVADPAVRAGGVVILSDIGNIDGEIMHRFERIKEAVFGPVEQGVK